MKRGFGTIDPGLDRRDLDLGQAGAVDGSSTVGPSGLGLPDLSPDPAVDPSPPERAPGDTTLWTPPVPVFTALLGAAGSGKTFATKDWASRDRGLALCATTGIAAINLGGTTINSLLGYFDTRSLQEKYTTGFLTAQLGRLWKAGVRRLVLDEVSMLDGDQFTYLVQAIDEVNGRGYVLGKGYDPDEDDTPPQMGLTIVGDFCQLPPVKAPFAFESSEWERTMAANVITLTEIKRQSEASFVEALRAARRGDSGAALAFFRYSLDRTTDDAFEGPTLFAKNEAVDRYNWIRMNKLQTKDLYFRSRREGKQRPEWGNPDKPPFTWGIPQQLHLKLGALVMILANKKFEPPSTRFKYVNGDLGTIVDADPDQHLCTVHLQRTDQLVDVEYVRREVLLPLDPPRRKELIALGQAEKIADGGKWEIAGWISYLPLRVAYATTVHKAQGLSLDRVQVTLADHFFKTPGMLYVALSRARSGTGLRLVGSEAAFHERCVADHARLGKWL